MCSDLSGGYGIVTSLGFVEKLLILFCGNNGKGFCSCFDVFLVTIQLRSCFCLEWTFITFPPAFLFFLCRLVLILYGVILHDVIL